MKTWFLALAALFLPALAFAQDSEFYVFEPTRTVSTLGIAYTILMVAVFLFVGWWSKKRVTTSVDYFAAGRGYGGVSNGLAMSSNYMSLATFLGFTALLWRLQYYVVALVTSFIGGFVLIGVVLAPALRRWGKFTSMQFIGERYGITAKVIAVICMIFLAQLYLIGQMKGVGNVFQVMFHLPYTPGLIIGGLVVTTYVTIGGMYGLSYNQTLQAIIMLIALYVPAVIILQQFGVGAPSYFPPFGYGSLVPEMYEALPSYFNPYLTVNGTVPMTPKYYFGVFFSIALGTMGLPHIAMRYFTAPSIRNAKMSTLWGTFFVGLVFYTTFAIGFSAKLYSEEVIRGEMGLQIEPSQADLLLVVMSQAFTPGWIAALPIAGALAAGMSTIGGLLMTIGTGLGSDIYSIINPNASDQSRVKMGYLFTALGGLATIILSLNPPDFLLTSVIWAFVVAASTFTPVLILGIWWKGANRYGAIAGLLIGGILSAVLWFQKGVLFGIPLIQAGPVGILVTGIFTVPAAWFAVVVVSLLTGGEKDERILREVDRIHGWQNYDSKRYSSNTFPLITAGLAVLIMIWSAMPDPAFVEWREAQAAEEAAAEEAAAEEAQAEEMAEAAAESVEDTVEVVEEAVTEAVEDTAETVEDTAETVEETTSEAVEDTTDAVEETTSEAVEGAAETVEDTTTAVEETTSEAVEGAAETVEETTETTETDPAQQ